MAAVAVALMSAAGCGNQNGAAPIPDGMHATPAMAQSEIDAQNAKHKAFVDMKKSD